MPLEPTVFIVDDDPAVRHSLARLLGAANHRTESFETAPAFLRNYDPHRAGCLLLDVRMPEMSGLELQATLNERAIQLPVIIITGHADVPMAVTALKGGAYDFIEKPFDDEALLDCVGRAIEHDRQLRTRCERQERCVAQIAALSPREREVLDGLAAGKTVEQIAYQLNISPKTVYMHRTHLMDKLGSDSVVDLVRIKLQAQNAAEASGGG